MGQGRLRPDGRDAPARWSVRSPARASRGHLSRTMAVDLSMPILIVDDYNYDDPHHPQSPEPDSALRTSTTPPTAPRALTKMRSRKYGLVISDWNMEPMTGYDLLREVRADPALAEDSVHHGHGRIEDRERDRGQEGRASTTTSSSRSTRRPCSTRSRRSSRTTRRRLPLGTAYRPGYHSSRRITAFGETPAAAKISRSAAGSGSSRPPSSSA